MINTNQVLYQWLLKEAVVIVNSVRAKTSVYNYYIGITGSVLYEGYSDNDLDLILYPEFCHEDYRIPLDIIVKELEAEAVCVGFKDTDHKLVYELSLKDGRKVNVFIPNYSMSGRLDNYDIKEINYEQTKTIKEPHADGDFSYMCDNEYCRCKE